jgi:hypothetical protein
MRRLPWAPWKFWNRIPSSPKRRIHLGIDYGTSVSKIVFRDYGAPGGESAVLVLRNGCCRIPSRVCMTATELLFGDDTKAAADCGIYNSLKMRVAVEVSGNPSYYHGVTTTLPDGFSAADLVALTVWFLISEGHRTVAAQFGGRMEGVEIAMTMGVPITFFTDEQLKASFLNIARRAWSFYCDEGLLDSALSTEKARRLLEKRPVALSAIPDHEVRDWIRCEGEASNWLVLHSPAVGIGPFAKVDIGAGITHANLFRIFGKLRTPKRSLAPFGAAAAPIGLDAVDRAIAECERKNSNCSALRGSEQSILEANAKVREALIPVSGHIYDSYRKAWDEVLSKLSSNALELIAWRQHKVLMMGGGSLMPLLVDTFRTHPDQKEPLSVLTLEHPADLVRADHRKITSEELPFVAVAYGLSNMEPHLPNPYCRDPG